MAYTPLEVAQKINRSTLAATIARTWDNYNSQRAEKIAEWTELRNYVFATDTSKTSNRKLPWKNSTTLPKLCQIRDNLHSNYISALFPHDSWLKWEGYSKEDAVRDKVTAIEAYMENKTRESHFKTEMSKLVYDFIDYGNAFVVPEFEASTEELPNGEKVVRYIGPKARRISPLDIVFNPKASSFSESFKIIRSLRTIGELKLIAASQPADSYLNDALSKRDALNKNSGAFTTEDFTRAEAYQVDGFGNYFEYLQSGYVELLEFYGDIHDQATGEMKTNRVITVIDRCWVIRDEAIDNWFGKAPIYHVGWRTRPDNLWSMGPLDNLVGLQYRLDHLENLKADAMDLAVLPPLVIQGEVEEFEYGPNAEIHIDENGTVTELARNAQWVIQANNEINYILSLMEQFAGAPSEAMGIRTPGEKTAFEVQQLQNAAGRIFQEKINTFEIELLEPLLNAMFEISKRFMDRADVAKVMDDDLGVQQFISITKDDITASGKIRPVGARHFAAQAQLMQNLSGLLNGPLAQALAPHLSTKSLARLVEDVMGLSRYALFQPNIAIFEQQETARLTNEAATDLQMEQMVGPDGVMQ